MRISNLEIAAFRNLQNFSISFDEQSLTTVLVGRNGAGKSNLLEAITIIFRNLDLRLPPAFKYRLTYNCRGNTVHIDADPDRPKHPVLATVDDMRIPYSRFSQPGQQQYLPNFVFGYYSGPSNRMESHFDRHQDRFYKDLLAGKDKPLRSLFYARLVHSQFVLLSFFTEKDPDALQFLTDYLRIEDLDSVLFVMREPPWSAKGTDCDPRFWNARGVVQRLLSNLYGLALAPLRTTQSVTLGFRRNKRMEHLYLYIQDAEKLRSLAGTYHRQQDFFKALESTYISELIGEVIIRVKARDTDGAITFRQLSEGEQQLLMVLGLLRFTKEDESLFLLDEPDTHLNPAWSLEYLELLNAVVGEQKTSHIIMATHDPLVIAGLERSQVQVVRRDEDGRVSASLPDQSPRGMGIAGLLTSDIYGLRSQLDLHTLGLLDRKRGLARKEELSDDEVHELSDLNRQLEGLDFTNTVRDPLYGRFVRAMSALEDKEGLTTPILTKNQQTRLDELAVQVIERLKANAENQE